MRSSPPTPNGCAPRFVESSNPVHSLADTKRWREAFEALEFSVVIDVAMTETAECADYVLPTSTQYEKAEATFFTFEFPENFFHLRRLIVDLIGGVLPKPEIHRRLCRELGVYNDDDLAPLRTAAPHGLDAYADAFLSVIAASPDLGRYLPVVLYETLGPVLLRAWNPRGDLGPLRDLRDQQPRVRCSGPAMRAATICSTRSSTTRYCCLLERLVRGHLGSHALRRQEDQSDRRRAHGGLRSARRRGPSGDQRRVSLHPCGRRTPPRRPPIRRARSRMAPAPVPAFVFIPTTPPRSTSSTGSRSASLPRRARRSAMSKSLTRCCRAWCRYRTARACRWPRPAPTPTSVYLNELTSVDDKTGSPALTTSTSRLGWRRCEAHPFRRRPLPIARVADLFGDWVDTNRLRDALFQCSARGLPEEPRCRPGRALVEAQPTRR